MISNILDSSPAHVLELVGVAIPPTPTREDPRGSRCGHDLYGIGLVGWGGGGGPGGEVCDLLHHGLGIRPSCHLRLIFTSDHQCVVTIQGWCSVMDICMGRE